MLVSILFKRIELRYDHFVVCCSAKRSTWVMKMFVGPTETNCALSAWWYFSKLLVRTCELKKVGLGQNRWLDLMKWVGTQCIPTIQIFWVTMNFVILIGLVWSIKNTFCRFYESNAYGPPWSRIICALARHEIKYCTKYKTNTPWVTLFTLNGLVWPF